MLLLGLESIFLSNSFLNFTILQSLSVSDQKKSEHRQIKEDLDIVPNKIDCLKRQSIFMKYFLLVYGQITPDCLGLVHGFPAGLVPGWAARHSLTHVAPTA